MHKTLSLVNCHSCQISNMADAALARREARRRKILANSQNRLQLISGKNGNELCKESPIKVPIIEPNHENSVPRESSSNNKCSLNNGVINTGFDPFSIISTSLENAANGEDVTISSHDLACLTPPASDPPQQSTPLWGKIANNKYDIVILSFLIRLLFSFYIAYENTYFFLPLLLYSVSKSLFYPEQQSSNLANAILLLNGVSASKIQKIMSVTHWISTFSQDVCVFLFTSICTQLLWQAVGDILV